MCWILLYWRQVAWLRHSYLEVMYTMKLVLSLNHSRLENSKCDINDKIMLCSSAFVVQYSISLKTIFRMLQKGFISFKYIDLDNDTQL